MRDRRRTTLACALAAVTLWALGCGGDASRGGPAGPAQETPDAAPEAVVVAEPPPPFDYARLVACPSEETLWVEARDAAEQRKELDRFRAASEQAAAACPDAWLPPWSVGEAILRADPAHPQEAMEQAHTWFTRAGAAAQAAGDPAGLAHTSNRAGYYWKARDRARAERHYRDAIASAATAGRDDIAGPIYANLAGMYYSSGRLAEAIDLFEQALPRVAAAGRPDQARTIGYLRAILLEDLGRYTEALAQLDETTTRVTRDGADKELPRLWVVRGNIDMLSGNLDSARDWFERVPPEDARQTINAALGLGRIALRENRLDDAERQLAPLTQREIRAGLALRAAVFYAEVEQRRGNHAAVAERLGPTIEQADATHDVQVSWLARLVLARSLLADGDAAGASRRLREAIDLIEARGEGVEADRSMAYLRERAEPYAELAGTLAAAGKPTDVLAVTELAHARALRQLLELDGDGLEGSNAVALQAGLAEGELLLDFLIGDRRGVVVAISPHEVRAEPLPGWSELRRPVQRYLQALKRPLISAEARIDPEHDLRRDIEGGRALRRTLLGPVAGMVDAAERIYVVPDQDLALLPFAALPLDGDGDLDYLGWHKQIAVMPMAGTPRAWTAERGPLLLAGDPLPDAAGEFGALRLAAEELDGVRSIWSAVEATRLERDALVARRLLELPLERFRTLHFATHAIASSRDPQRCAVVLSGGEQLSFREIAELRLQSALVVLSACRTGEGEVVPGEGVVGLSWAFLRAGAQGVVASLWSVEDASTTELMVAFHERLREAHDPVTALALAQRDLAAGRPHPLYWAPFVVILSPGGTRGG